MKMRIELEISSFFEKAPSSWKITVFTRLRARVHAMTSFNDLIYIDR
jgi:hypothetical protein